MAENPQVHVATRTAHVNYGTDRTVIKKGVTRVAAGHPLLDAYPDFFKPADEGLRFGVEDAVARPDDLASVIPNDPYKGAKKADLEKEIEDRNASRTDDTKIVVGGTGKVDDLKAALRADDDATPATAPQPGDSDSDDAPTPDDAPAGLSTDDVAPAGQATDAPDDAPAGD